MSTVRFRFRLRSLPTAVLCYCGRTTCRKLSLNCHSDLTATHSKYMHLPSLVVRVFYVAATDLSTVCCVLRAQNPSTLGAIAVGNEELILSVL